MAQQHHVPLAPAHSDRDGLNERAVARGSSIWTRFCFELKAENVWLNGDYPRTYGKLHWARAFGAPGAGCWCCARARGDQRHVQYSVGNLKLWLLWRVFVFAFLFGVFVYSLAVEWNDGYYAVYLTHWQTGVFAIYSLLALVSAVYIQTRHSAALADAPLQETAKLIGAAKNSDVEYHMPYILRATWYFFDLSVTSGLWVTVFFWAHVALFGFSNPEELPLLGLEHGATFAVVVLDFSFNGIPWMLMHFVWSAVMGIAYIIFSGAFYAAGMTNKVDGGRYIYKGLEWDKPVQTGFLLVIVMCVGMPLINLVIWIASSEQVLGTCAARREVAWGDIDGTGGHRPQSWKPQKKQGATLAPTGGPIVQEV